MLNMSEFVVLTDTHQTFISIYQYPKSPCLKVLLRIDLKLSNQTSAINRSLLWYMPELQEYNVLRIDLIFLQKLSDDNNKIREAKLLLL